MNVEIVRGFSWQNAGLPEELHAGDQRTVPDTVGRRWVRDGLARDLEPAAPAAIAVGPRTLSAPETKDAPRQRRR